MFKKFTQSDGVATNTQAKSSVIRRITKNIVECYPSMEEKLPAMFPKKVPVYLTKCKDNNVTMVVCQNIPWFFQHRKDDFVPTLHMLHRFPDLLPKVKVDRGAIKFVLGGAQIMCPGLTSKGGEIDEKIEEGTVVAVMAEGKELACAIGIMKLSGADVKKINKGVAIEPYTYLNDGLWLTPEFE